MVAIEKMIKESLKMFDSKIQMHISKVANKWFISLFAKEINYEILYKLLYTFIVYVNYFYLEILFGWRIYNKINIKNMKKK